MPNNISDEIGILRASGQFDEPWYLERYPDVAALDMDPVKHYLWLGARLGRDPSAQFSSRGYLALHPDVAHSGMNPLVHYALRGEIELRRVQPPTDFAVWTQTRVDYVERRSFEPLDDRRARVVAMYLPQFHAIPENDTWWGDGFTEWSNVRTAKPHFIGQYQPHEPHPDIGYYDLSSTAAQFKQIEMAKAYGIEGFCFYYYWFDGKRLLEKPVDNYLNDHRLDLPFCLCWANENWSRRWDGLDSEILMAQAHSPQDDLRVIGDLARYIRDERYIRVNGKPLVVIYRPSLLPSPRETAKLWRNWCRDSGIGEIYLAYTQSFENADPADYGFDAAIEFPPNNSAPPDLTNHAVATGPDYNGRVYDWRALVERSNHYADPGYKLFRSVCPGWDNTARRKTGGTAFVGNTPELFRQWLGNAVKDTVRRFENADERLVFVNAWNEWAEGAHLEPDQASGYAYLEATRAALAPPDAALSVAKPARKLILVGHDAYQHGAQYLALHLARTMSEDLGYSVQLLLLGIGPLTEAYGQRADVHRLDSASDAQIATLVTRLHAEGAELAICNTLVSARILPILNSAGLKVVMLVHELPNVIQQYALEDMARVATRLANKIVFAAEPIARGFETFSETSPAQREIVPQGLYHRNDLRRQDGGLLRAKRELRARFGIPASAPIVLGVGYADRRKGIDLYIKAGVKLLHDRPDAWFIWLGRDAEPDWMVEAKRDAEEAGVIGRFIFPGFVEKPDVFFAGADVFALTSREDPYPSVVLDAMDCGTPVVAFAGTGGMEELLHRYGGLIVPAFDVAAYAQALTRALSDAVLRENCARNGPDIIDGEYSMLDYARTLVRLGAPPPRVSVIVPNYNYARYIVDRLRSITAQSLQPCELIVLDDKSSDDSVSRIREFLADCPIPWRFDVNETNSGSVFRQWRKGAEMARGDLVWIAEADDLASPDFLANTSPAFADSKIVMSYCQSRQIDENGQVVSDHYLDYVSDIDDQRWQRGYVAPGMEEIARALFVKNTIPNVSAVVFRRDVLLKTLRTYGGEIMSLRNAGDWLAYIRVLESGDIAYCSRALNDHRRHAASVTLGNANRRHLDEIVQVQAETIARYRLGPAATSTARRYAERVARQFGLDIDHHPATEVAGSQ